ncbi:stressosome-associated protein Prli42 [Hazenella coriacea]|nr:stressosome-associated protein Prli42 [Hazenella coriacea]
MKRKWVKVIVYVIIFTLLISSLAAGTSLFL